ncbi:lytic transglycosylase domain-containing protein [Microbacterium deminutum]|uniref:Lytic transglycosylase domain-containing protein n=1 Tax=Microbacterium deminutum TaxID=344164 RepID=A0ABN2R8B4_9MICO
MLGVFAAFAALGFVIAYVGPTGLAVSQAKAEVAPPLTLYASSLGDVQTHTTEASAVSAEPAELGRGGYSVYVKPKPKPKPKPPPVVVAPARSTPRWSPPFVAPNPGTAQAIAYDMVKARGWGDDEFACLVSLWNRESGWRVNAYNAGSGAYGIPQALPGSKMGSAGADWATNPATQITWGLGYVTGRYGTPCGAWSHSQSTGWY